MSVTDQVPAADVLQRCTRPRHCRHCRYCKRCIRCVRPQSVSHSAKANRDTRKDTKYCSGKCRTAACRKRQNPVLEKEETQ
jgi:hypothetical protein